MIRRKKGGYFKRIEGTPKPLVVLIKRRVSFSEVDLAGIVWHGRYPVYFEEGFAELGRQCGLSYKDYLEANLLAPIVQFHIDYYESLVLEEEFTIKASLVWCEGARLNIEYTMIKQNGNISATGYTVQMFTDRVNGDFYIAPPELVERCRRRWETGEFACLQ